MNARVCGCGKRACDGPNYCYDSLEFSLPIEDAYYTEGKEPQIVPHY
jgi:hypothetical protein